MIYYMTSTYSCDKLSETIKKAESINKGEIKEAYCRVYDFSCTTQNELTKACKILREQGWEIATSSSSDRFVPDIVRGCKVVFFLHHKELSYWLYKKKVRTGRDVVLEIFSDMSNVDIANMFIYGIGGMCATHDSDCEGCRIESLCHAEYVTNALQYLEREV